MKIQVTFFCDTNKYKPIATVIEVPSFHNYMQRKAYWLERAKASIRAKRYWSAEEMESFGYTVHKERILKGE